MSRVDDARAKLSEARERVADLNRNRHEHQRRIEELRAEKREAEQAAEVREWVPDSLSDGEATATATKTAERLEQMEEELERLEGAHERAEQAVEEAEAELAEAVKEKVPGLAEDAVAATRRIYSAYESLGNDVGDVEAFEELLEARQDVHDALDEMRRLRALLPDSAGGFEKASAIRQAIKRALRTEVSGATLLGYEVAGALGQLQNRPHLAEPLADAGLPVEPVPSPFHQLPAGNAREAVRNNRLPLTVPQI